MLPRVYLAMSGDVFDWRVCCWHQWVEIRDATKHTAMCRTASRNTDYAVQHVSSAEVEETCARSSNPVPFTVVALGRGETGSHTYITS